MRTLPATRTSPAPLLTRLREGWARVVELFESRPAAYLLIALLQLKLVWGIWAFKDVTGGDTASYFAEAWRWYDGKQVNIAWSPLYTAFYGSFLHINPDPVWATVAHRVVIVLLSAVLALAVFRQFLPPSIAWLCGAWWACLPIVFNTMYEVHLFSVLPVLVVWLLLLTARGPWRRAAALGLLAASAVLVRNELALAVAVLGLGLLVSEVRRLRRGDGPRFWPSLLPYAVALAAAAALCGAAYARSTVKYPELKLMMSAKHTLNMTQVYAYGYGQRHPDWNLNAMTQGFGVMRETFGNPQPSLKEMMAVNPKAVWEHFAWNAGLTPAGLQLLLFNRVSGSVHPDYFPPTDSRLNHRGWPLALSLLVLVIWVVGLVAIAREWRGRWRAWLTPRALGWLGVFAVVCVTPAVILTQRPRPSYLFGLGIGLIAFTGMCFWAATARWRVVERLRLALPVLAVGLLVGLPGYFGVRKHLHRYPIKDGVARLAPYRAELERPGVTTFHADVAIGLYVTPLATGTPTPPPPVHTYAYAEDIRTVIGDWPQSKPFAGMIARADYVYMDESVVGLLEGTRKEECAAFVAGRDAPGWELVDGGDRQHDRWRLYRKAR